MILTSSCVSNVSIIIPDGDTSIDIITNDETKYFIAADDETKIDIITDDDTNIDDDTTVAAEESKYPVPTAFIALTFDDGPSYQTHRLLDVLKEHNIKATFFVSGVNMVKTDEIFVTANQRKIDEGHEFANHAFYHYSWGNGNFSFDSMRRDFLRCQNEIIRVTGKSTPFFRAPNLSRNNVMTRVLRDLEMFDILGYSPDDWRAGVTAKTLVDIITRESIAVDGQIFLLHDHGRTNVIQAIPQIAHILRLRGIDFMTLSELAEHRGIDLTTDFGKVYSRF